MNNKLLDKFNEIERTHWWWEGRRQLVKFLIGNKKPTKILDIGCGTGETLTFLQQVFPKAKLFGVDPSSRAVRYSKLRGHLNISKAYANKLPFKDNTFDVVLFLDVLEHIKDDNGAIAESKRILKKGGLIIITGPALSFIWSDHDTMQGHQRRYTRRAIRKLAYINQLRPTFVSYFNFFLSPAIILVRVMSKLSPFKGLSSYDRSMSYDIANASIPNRILKGIFMFEIDLLKFIKYPIGISVAAKLTK